MLRVLVLSLLSGCGAAAATPATPAPPGPPAEMVARVFYAVDELGPLAPLVDPSLDLTGRVLVLPGAALPGRAAAVVVRDPTVHDFGVMAPAAVTAPTAGYASAAESIHATIVEGRLVLTYEHDVNTSGWCCSGMVMPDREACSTMPALAPVPAGDDVTVWLFVVPREAANGITVARETTICVRP